MGHIDAAFEAFNNYLKVGSENALDRA